jgi:hypothetical protein
MSLVRQLGPWKPTLEDLFQFSAPPARDPSDIQILSPDGSPNGVDVNVQPTMVAGNLQNINGSVVGPTVEDNRFTAPGRQVSTASRYNMAPLAYRPEFFQPVVPPPPVTAPPTTTTTYTPALSWNFDDLKKWDTLSERQRSALIKRAGGNEKLFAEVIPKMTRDEKDEFARVTRAHFNRMNNIPPPCRRENGCTKEEREAEIAANEQFMEIMKLALGALVEVIF